MRGLSAFVIGLTLATVPQQVGIELPPDLARVLTDYEAAWRKGDGAVLSNLFAEDGFVLPSGAPPVRGRDAIRQYYHGPGGPLVLRAFAYAAEGSVGSIIGGFSRQEGQPDVGKFTLTLRKNDQGRWLIVSDMDNGNARPRCSAMPAAVAAAAQRLIASDNSRDLAGVLNGYTDDVVWYPPDGKILNGKDSIRPRYEESFSKFRFDLSSEIAEARADGNLGFIRGFITGTLKPLEGGAAVSVDDQFVALVRCQEGDWRVSHLIWNSRKH